MNIIPRIVFFLLSISVYGQVINRAEYFIDSDPGNGNATTVTTFTPAGSVNFNFSVPVSSLSVGFHTLGLRMRESVTGRWSHTNFNVFYILPPVSFPTSTKVVAGEYFFDSDPGFGNGTPLSFTPGNTVNITALNVNIGALLPGFHFISFRFRDDRGQWTHASAQSFYVIPPITTDLATSITRIEYFFNTDLGPGNNTSLPITAGDPQNNSFPITLPGTLSPGFHKIGFRYRDNKNRWSHAETRTFYVVPPLPPLNRQIIAAEYYVDSPQGTSTPIPIPGINAGATLDQLVALDMTGVPTGNHTLSIRIKDSEGVWSYLETKPFTISSCIPPPSPTAQNGSRCNAGTVTLTATGATGAQVYRWYDDPILNNLLFTGASFTTPVLTASKSYYTSIYDPGTNCESARVTVNAVVITIVQPSINPSGSLSICEGSSVFLSGPAGFVQYQWFKDGVALTSTAQSIQVTQAGNYTVQTGDGTCLSPVSAATEVTLVTLPPKPVISTSGTTNLCDGSTVTLTAPSGFTYLWSTGETTPAITVSASGNYTVTVTNANGCASTSSDAVIVTANTTPPKPVIEVFGSTTLCGTNTVALLAPLQFTVFQWSSGQTTPGITVSAAGSYTVRVGNAANCLSVPSDPVSVTNTNQPCVPVGGTNAPPVIIPTTTSVQIEGRLAFDLTTIISDNDNNLDFNSLRVVNGQTSRGIPAFVDGAYFLTIDYSGNASPAPTASRSKCATSVASAHNKSSILKWWVV